MNNNSNVWINQFKQIVNAKGGISGPLKGGISGLLKGKGGMTGVLKRQMALPGGNRFVEGGIQNNWLKRPLISR